MALLCKILGHKWLHVEAQYAGELTGKMCERCPAEIGKRYPKEVDTDTLRAVLHGRPVKRGADPTDLKEKLKSNRSRSKRGHGEEYWDSVIAVIEEHYGIKS